MLLPYFEIIDNNLRCASETTLPIVDERPHAEIALLQFPVGTVKWIWRELVGVGGRLR
jgi:hypothetical protein